MKVASFGDVALAFWFGRVLTEAEALLLICTCGQEVSQTSIALSDGRAFRMIGGARVIIIVASLSRSKSMCRKSSMMTIRC